MKQIKINEALWNSISEEQQNAIISNLRAVGALTSGDQILPDEHTPVGNTAPDAVRVLADGACEMACTATYESACAYCTSLPPQAAAVCYGTAAAVYGACLAACALE